MTALSIKELDALLRSDFMLFLDRCFKHLNPGYVYMPNWHLEVMAAHLEDCRLGRSTRLIVNMPPRHLKSITVSVAYVAWLLGHNPSLRIICVSYSQSLADKHALDCRSIMQSAWYQRLFPGTRLSPEKMAVNDFTTTAHGCRMATSVGGTLTGRGADVIIIDDPLKPDEAVSDTQREVVNGWYDRTLYSRLNDKARSVLILVMQRLHQDDLVGRVLEQEPWTHLRFPAIAEEDETHIIDTPYGRKTFTRRLGEPLHPEREPLELLHRLKELSGEYNFAGQYQQSPAPLGGGLIKEKWLRRYEPNELPDIADEVIQSWDTANKPGELNSYCVCTTWRVKGDHAYLVDVYRARLNYPDLKRAVKEKAFFHKATVILIEDKASGTQLIQDLIDEGMHGVTRYQPDGDKIMRLHAQTGTIENGFVHVPKEAPWLPEYLLEITTFPNSRYTDQADSTAQALDWIKKRKHAPGMGIYYYYKSLYEERQREKG